MNMVSGKRNVAVLGREAKHCRPITLLSTDVKINIDPSRWVQISSAKQFDDKNTSFLRVSKHKYVEDKFLVHGMRAQVPDGEKKAAIIAEAYDLVASKEQVAPTLAKIAAYCGISVLIGEVK